MKNFLKILGASLALFIVLVMPTEANFSIDLYPGMDHPQARSLQQLLNTQGYTVAASGDGSRGMETTIMGPATVAALKRFQTANGINPTGVVGPLTRTALNTIVTRTQSQASQPVTIIQPPKPTSIPIIVPPKTNITTPATTTKKKRPRGGGGGGGGGGGSTQSPTPAPVATLSSSPTTIVSGTSATLSWSSTNATSCTGTNFATGNATAGSQSVSPTVTTTYTVACTGAGGSDTESVVVTVNSASEYPTLASVQGLSNPSLAFGLNGIADWSSVIPFIDLMKMSRPWFGHLPNQWGGVDNEQLISGGYLDAQGWPTSIPSNVTHLGAVWDWSDGRFGAGTSRAGDYVLTYEGEGDLDVVGVSNKVVTGKRITFTFSGTGTLFLNLYATTNGDHLRNIVIVRAEHEELHEAGAVFNPDWLDLIKDSRQVRFMDWMGTNNSELANWSDRRQLDYSTWSDEVPIEIQVRLANEIGADPWFNIPFDANDTFITNFAVYVRDNLDPQLRATVELSNEVWNFAFGQAQDAIARAEQKFGVAGGAGWVNYYGMRAGQAMQIWTNVFGSQTSTRLQRVVGAQTGWPALTYEMLVAPMWQQSHPGEYFPPHEYLDAVAGTSYFGGSLVTTPAYRNRLMQEPEGNRFNFNKRMLQGLEPGFTEGSIPSIISFLNTMKDTAEDYGLEVVIYEGGQHEHHSAFVSIPQNELEQLQTHLTGFVRSQEMADLYEELWDEWQAIGDGPFMQFVDVGMPNQYGSWGLWASLLDSTPRSIYLVNKNNATPAWFENRGGDRFRQGRLVEGTSGNNTLVGTAAEDYILARAGNDIIYAGPGNDGIHGGGGTDTALFSGNRNQYTITAEGAGHRISGPDGSDYLFDVELLTFEDTTISVSGGQPPAAPTATLNASPTSVVSGNNATLTWSSTNASTCTGTNFSTSNATSGSVSVSPTVTTLYTLSCTGAGGTDTDTRTVTVTTEITALPLNQRLVISGHSIPDGIAKGPLQDAIASMGGTAQIWGATGPFASAQFRWENPVSTASPDNIRALMEAPGASYDAFIGIEAHGGNYGGRASVVEHITWSNGYAMALNWHNLAASTGAQTYYMNFWRNDPAQLFGSAWRSAQEVEKPFWNNIIDHVNANKAQGTTDMYKIPLLEVFTATYDAIETGTVTGVTMADFFVDDVHVSTPEGKWLQLATTLAVVYRIHPDELPANAGTQANISPTLAAQLRPIVWLTVTADSRSGL